MTVCRSLNSGSIHQLQSSECHELNSISGHKTYKIEDINTKNAEYDYADTPSSLPPHDDGALSRSDSGSSLESNPNYDNLYWCPSSEKEDLIVELQKLKLKNFSEKELM